MTLGGFPRVVANPWTFERVGPALGGNRVDLPEPLVAIARVQIERGRPRAARRALEGALELDPENAGAKRLEERLADRV